MKRLFRRKPKHKHVWTYHPRTIAGWGIVTCPCGESDLY